MPFDYYKRLPRARQRIYVESDRISSVRLPNPGDLYPLVEELRRVLTAEDRLLVQKAAQGLVTNLLKGLKVRPLRVKVLAQRPSDSRGELQGLYQPDEGGTTDQMILWMRTARRKQVVAFKTFLRTLLHELSHHLDYELLGLKETFHTQGFFKRESSLFHQLVPESGKEKKR